MSNLPLSSGPRVDQTLLVTAAIIHDGQRLLIAQRRFDSKNEGGKWEFPGGKVEFAENPETCLIREMKEELGVDIRIERLFNVVSHVFEVSGQVRHIVLLSYIAGIVNGEPRPIEVETLRWIDINELSEFQFASADTTIVKKILGDGKI